MYLRTYPQTIANTFWFDPTRKDGTVVMEFYDDNGKLLNQQTLK